MAPAGIVGTALVAVPIALVALFAQSALWTRSVSDDASDARRATQFVDGLAAAPSQLNPILYADTASGQVVSQVSEGLTTYDESLRLAPALARDWTLTHRAFAAIPAACTSDALAVSLSRSLGADKAEVIGASDAPPWLVEPGRSARWLDITVPSVDTALEARLTAAMASAGCAGFDANTLSHHPTVTFELREDVRWHDGEPFDADDVAFTFRAIMDEANLSPRRADFETVAALDVLGPHRVRVTYADLYSPGLSIWGIGVLPEHRLGQAALDADGTSFRDHPFSRAPIGTGPYRFEMRERDDTLTLVRNADYWRDALAAPAPDATRALERYVIRVLPDAFTRELEFLGGGLDVYGPEPHQVDRYREDPAHRLLTGPAFSYAYIGYNGERAPFDDVRVRTALGLAIDTQAIIDNVLYGQGARTTGPYPRETPWYDHDVAPLPFDRERARALLREAGFSEDADGWLSRDGKPLAVNLVTNNGNETRKAILSIVQDAWRAIGVRTQTLLVEWSVFLKDYVNAQDFDAIVLGWRMTPDHDLYQLWHSSQIGGQRLNFTSYRSDEADALIERLRREYAPERLTELAHALHARIATDQPYTFLYSTTAARALARTLLDRDAEGNAVAPAASNTGSANIDLWRWRRGAMLEP